MANIRKEILSEDLQSLYWQQSLSARQIGKIYNCSETTIRTRMRDFGIIKKTPSLARMKYVKKDFLGPTELKAYLIGFRLGDMNVYQTSPQSELIVARSNTTQQVQIDLIKALFQPYGKVTVSKGKYSTNINCYLNRTFEFLLPKNEEALQWIEKVNSYCFAFIAGYIDAEGNFILNQEKARLKVDSYDFEILRWIYYYLVSKGLKVKLRCLLKAKEKSKWMKAKKDLWRLNINDGHSLKYLIESIQPFCQHTVRLEQMYHCLNNINGRMNKGSL